MPAGRQEITIKAPLKDEEISKLKVGDRVFINGILYVARDLAHMRIIGLIEKKKPLPFDMKGQIIFYAGPTPGKNSLVSTIGPTTASRMDKFHEELLAQGIKATIGKGPRNPDVKKVLEKYRAVYFIATGGVAALLGEKVISAEMVAFPELGPEAILKLEVSKFPVIVAYDSNGGDLFEEGRKKYGT
ncbi:fumarate hydratase C-terminal domain-containing protein [Candidatus Saganbacteria bacterium]|nr:fumarate hydratase C-terminal domain-containing protein [Candidatus Saganbacteria bacterium]